MATGKFGAALRRAVGIGGRSIEGEPRKDSRALTSTHAGDATESGGTCNGVSDPVEHAKLLLRWLQGEGGATGEVPASEVQRCYVEMCAEQHLNPLSWYRVGRELGRITGPRRHRDLPKNGRRVRSLVYSIPASGMITDRLERSSHPSATLPRRLDAIDARLAEMAAQVGAIADVLRAGTAGAGHSTTGGEPGRTVNFFERGGAV